MIDRYTLKLPDDILSPLSIRAKIMIFEDPASLDLLQRIRKIAPSTANVLIIGETGTGKELIAREIHNLSDRKDETFIAVNCGAFNESLIESELFGHEKGAFTGAISSKKGWFEEANGGTLFLDEIGDMPLPLQVKLLRVIQEGQLTRLGSRKNIQVNTRIITATNINLEDAVISKKFREDLFYRLNVATVHLLPLRERIKDIPPLIEYFIKLYSKRLNISDTKISQEAFDILVHQYTWPGNIRELENIIHQSLLICRGNIINKEDLNLSLKIKTFQENDSLKRTAQYKEENFKNILNQFFINEKENLYKHLDKYIFEQAYEYAYHNQSETARILGISRNIVRSKLIDYKLLNPKKHKK